MRKLVLYSMFLILLIDVMFDIGLGFGRGLSVKNLYLYMIVVMIGVDVALKPGGIIFSDLDIHIPFVLLIGYATLSWAISSAISPVYPAFDGLVRLKSGLVDFYMFWLVYRYGVKTQEDYYWLIKAIVGTLLVTSVITLVDFLNMPDLGIIGVYAGRVEGPIGQANQYGALLAFILPMSVALVADYRRMARYLWLGGILVTALLFLATGSRGAYVALTAGSLGGAFYLRRFLSPDQVRRAILLGTAVVVVVGVIYAFVWGEVLNRIIEKSTSGDLRSISSGRLDIWVAGILAMAEWPFSFLIGYGWTAWDSPGIARSAHNVYLTFLYELGVIGLLLFANLLRAVLSHSRRAMSRLDQTQWPIMTALVIGLCAICVAIIFSSIVRLWPIIWTLTGLIVGYARSCSSKPIRQRAEHSDTVEKSANQHTKTHSSLSGAS